MNQTYAVDIRNFSYSELWRLAPGLSFLLAARHRLFGIPRRISATVTRLDGLTILKEGDVPGDVTAALDPMVKAWESLGFQAVFRYTVPSIGPGRRSFAAALLSLDGRIVAQVMFVEVSLRGITRRQLVTSCYGFMADGTYVGATSERKRFNPPPQFKGVYLPGAQPQALCEACLRQLGKAVQTYPVVQTTETLEALIVKVNNAHVDFQVSRGVYVPVELAP